jgi:hypothetical protein
MENRPASRSKSNFDRIENVYATGYARSVRIVTSNNRIAAWPTHCIEIALEKLSRPLKRVQRFQAALFISTANLF